MVPVRQTWQRQFQLLNKYVKKNNNVTISLSPFILVLFWIPALPNCTKKLFYFVEQGNTLTEHYETILRYTCIMMCCIFAYKISLKWRLSIKENLRNCVPGVPPLDLPLHVGVFLGMTVIGRMNLVLIFILCHMQIIWHSS